MGCCFCMFIFALPIGIVCKLEPEPTLECAMSPWPFWILLDNADRGTSGPWQLMSYWFTCWILSPMLKNELFAAACIFYGLNTIFLEFLKSTPPTFIFLEPLFLVEVLWNLNVLGANILDSCTSCISTPWLVLICICCFS